MRPIESIETPSAIVTLTVPPDSDTDWDTKLILVAKPNQCSVLLNTKVTIRVNDDRTQHGSVVGTLIVECIR